MRRTLLSVVALFAFVEALPAANVFISGNAFVPGPLPDYVTNDIEVSFDNTLRGQQMIIELTQGSIYQQQPLGSNLAPNPALLGLIPELEFDSFVTMGGLTSQSSEPMLEVGGAVNLGGSATKKFDTEGINIAWSPSTGVDITSGIDFVTARITLSNDAAGTLKYLASTADFTEAVLEMPIYEGVIGRSPPWPPWLPLDIVIDNVIAGTTVTHRLPTEHPINGPILWTDLEFTGAPAFGGTGEIGPNLPTLASDGQFLWDTTGSARGAYTARATLNYENGVTDTAKLTINVTAVPEPGSGAILLMAAVLGGLTRGSGVCRESWQVSAGRQG